MGLKKWLINKILAGEVKKLRTQQAGLSAELNEELKNTSLEYRDALKEAKTISKILEARRRIKSLRDDIRGVSQELDDDDEEDDEEEEEKEDTIEQEIINFLKEPLMNKLKGGSTQQTAATQPSSSSVVLSPLKNNLIEKIHTMSDEEITTFLQGSSNSSY